MKAQEDRLLSYRNRLNTIRRERNGASEWTLEERSFVEKIAGNKNNYFLAQIIPFLALQPPLHESLKSVKAEKREVSDRHCAKYEELGVLVKKFNQSYLQPRFVDKTRSLGRPDFYRSKRSTQEILVAIGEMCKDVHHIR